MAMKVSVAARNALLQGVRDSTVSPNRALRIMDTVQTDPDTQVGTVLAEVNPIGGFGSPSAGSMAFSGTWQDLTINATGTAAGFRLVGANSPFYNVCGTVTATGGGGDMEVDTVSFVAGQSFAVTSFTLTCV